MNKSNRMEDNNYQSKVRKIFVGGLSADLTEVEFKKYFEKFGRITDVVVMHDSSNNRPRGFGFITFDSVESVDSVLQNTFHELNGRLVEVKRAVPKRLNYTSGHNSNPSNMRTRGGKGPLPNLNTPLHYPSYGSNYANYPAYTPFPHYGGHYGGLGVDLYGPSLWSWYPFGLYDTSGLWYDPNFVGVGMYPSPSRNFPTHPIYSSKGVKLSHPVARNGIVDTRRNMKINQAVRGNGNMSADAVPFQIKDKA